MMTEPEAMAALRLLRDAVKHISSLDTLVLNDLAEFLHECPHEKLVNPEKAIISVEADAAYFVETVMITLDYKLKLDGAALAFASKQRETLVGKDVSACPVQSCGCNLDPKPEQD